MGTNRILLFSWSLEAVIRVTLKALQFKTDREIVALDLLHGFLSQINYTLFLMQAFKLKAVLIYLDEENTTYEKIKS